MVEITGIVLAGGKSQRFGSNKALFPLNGKPIISHVLETLCEIFPKVLVVTKDPGSYHSFKSQKIQILKDLSLKFHPLNGLYSALKRSPTEKNFIAACDMPHLQKNLIEALLRASTGYDAAVCRWKGNPQPLCGVYSKSCLETVRLALDKEEGSLRKILSRVRTRFFSEEEVSLHDPQGLSFRDIDTREDSELFSHAS